MLRSKNYTFFSHKNKVGFLLQKRNRKSSFCSNFSVLKIFGFIPRVEIIKIRKCRNCGHSTDSSRNSHSISSKTASFFSYCGSLDKKLQLLANNCFEELSIKFFVMKSLKSKEFQKALTKLMCLVTQPPCFTVTMCLILNLRVSNENFLQLVQDDLIGDSLILFLHQSFHILTLLKRAFKFDSFSIF